MLQTLHRWQHKLLHALFGIPEDAEPPQARHPALRNRPLQNHPLVGHHHQTHPPRLLNRWQTNIGTFIERRFAQRRSR
jgi:RecB family exonuclease